MLSLFHFPETSPLPFLLSPVAGCPSIRLKCILSCVCVYHMFYIPSLVSEHLNSPLWLGPVNMRKQASLQQTDFRFSELNRSGGIAGSQGSLYLPFTSSLLLCVTAVCYIPIPSVLTGMKCHFIVGCFVFVFVLIFRDRLSLCNFAACP